MQIVNKQCDCVGNTQWRTLIRLNAIEYNPSMDCYCVQAVIPAWSSDHPFYLNISDKIPRYVLSRVKLEQPPIRLHVKADLEANDVNQLIDSLCDWEEK